MQVHETSAETLIAFGSQVKALAEGRVGDHLIIFGSSENKDIAGEYFTSETYFGAKDGDGLDVMVHHGKAFHSRDPEIDA